MGALLAVLVRVGELCMSLHNCRDKTSFVCMCVFLSVLTSSVSDEDIRKYGHLHESAQ